MARHFLAVVEQHGDLEHVAALQLRVLRDVALDETRSENAQRMLDDLAHLAAEAAVGLSEEDEGLGLAQDGTRPFVVVLIESAEVRHPLLPIAHLGVGCRSREEVDRLASQARAEGRACYGPIDAGYPVGYFALISDPDDHTLEVAHGQEVGLTVERASTPRP